MHFANVGQELGVEDAQVIKWEDLGGKRTLAWGQARIALGR